MSDGSVDLHCHTTASDGTFTPGELVEEARRRGLVAIAVTDHDSVAGIDEAMAGGAAIGVEIVPGLELSTDVDDGEVHILGYFIDPEDRKLLGLLESQRESRLKRVRKMLDRLSDLGVELSMDEVRRFSDGGPLGRPHVAQALIRAGEVGSWDEAFSRYIGRYAPAYVRRSKLSPHDAIRAILAAGGVPVLAHPGLSGHDGMIPSLVEAGLAGIEAVYPDHSEEQRARYAGLARRYGLIITAGSDCHGPRSSSGIRVGFATTDYSVVRQLREKALMEKGRTM
ncbi:MAG: PHP domain-containing protein [Bacillota bacterium]